MIPKKILISGGWGYANLGDDAILSSTLKLVTKKYPEAEVVVMTYDPIEGVKIFENEKVKFISSVHRHMIGAQAFRKFKIKLNFNADTFVVKWNKDSFIQKTKRKISREYYDWYERSSFKKYLKLKKDLDKNPLLREFQSADLFILGGGGYFNGSWKSNLFAHVLEFDLAKKAGVKTLFIGQTVEAFKDEKTLGAAKSAFCIANRISVRDIESYKDLISYGYTPTVIPDTALSEVFFPNKMNELIIITGGKGLSDIQADILAKATVNIQKSHRFIVKVIISRLWESDINSAFRVYNRLLKVLKNVKIVIPSNLQELQREMLSGKVIVSQNLHGLILGWRAGGECVCLTSSRKFLSFMEQTHQADMVVFEDTYDANSISNKISNAFKKSGKFNELRLNLANNVTVGFMKELDLVCKD